jgi:hypothetical protein
MSTAARLFIQEVAPRDGLQIERLFVPTGQKIELINELSQTGLAKIEVTSFTSPKAIPTLADADAESTPRCQPLSAAPSEAWSWAGAFWRLLRNSSPWGSPMSLSAIPPAWPTPPR